LLLAAGLGIILTLPARAADPYADNPFPVPYRQAPADPELRWAGFQSRVGTYLPTDPYHFSRVDVTNRAEMLDVYWSDSMVGATVPKNWNGSFTTLDPGKTTQAWRNAVLRELNLQRYFYFGANATYVPEDLTWNTRLQAAAFVTAYNGYYKHVLTLADMPPGFQYADLAADGALNNIGGDYTSYDVVNGFISDYGNPVPDHRISMMDALATVAGIGSVGANDQNANRHLGAADVLRVADMDITYYKYGIGGYAAFDGSKVPLPPQGDPFVKYQVWPYNGFVPIDAINGSPTPFSVDLFAAGMQLDASDMRVTVKKNGVPVPVSQIQAFWWTSWRQGISFVVDHGNLLSAVFNGLGNQDVVFDVTVENVRYSRTAVQDLPTGMGSIAYLALADPSAFQNHTIQWTFTVFDPEGVKPASYSSKSEITALSTRATVSSGDNVLIAGFIVDGNGSSEPLRVAIRAQGPSLKQYGLQHTATNPRLDLYQSSDGRNLGGNDDWKQGANWRLVQSFNLNPSDDHDPVVVATLAPGLYTAQVSDGGGANGIGIAEIFAIDSQSADRLSAVSTRGLVGTGEASMIAGFITQQATTLVIRTQGPSLARYGVTGVVSGTKLTLYRQSDGAVLKVNTGWNAPGNERLKTDLASYAPLDAREAALVVTLPAGAYTAIVESADGTPGVGIVEVYRVN